MPNLNMPNHQHRRSESLTLQLRGLHAKVRRFEPAEERRRSSNQFPPDTAVERPARDSVVGAMAEAPPRSRVRVRESLYRRSLAIADGAAALFAIVVAATVIGQDHVELATLAVLPLVVLIYKIAGLYERDQLVLKRSTLDEAPLLFKLAGLFALATWLLGDRLIAGELGRDQVLGLWGILFTSSLQHVVRPASSTRPRDRARRPLPSSFWCVSARHHGTLSRHWHARSG